MLPGQAGMVGNVGSYTLSATNIASSATFSTEGTPLYTNNPSELNDGTTSDAIGHGIVWNFARSSAVSNGCAVIADFGASNDKRIGKWKFYAHSGRGIEEWKVEYSDNGSSWTECATLDTTAAAGAFEEIEFAEVGTHRYWRILASSDGPDSQGAGTSEVELFEWE